MSISKKISVAMVLAAGAFALPASAATWSLEKNVTGVEVTDDTNNGGTTKIMNIFLSSAGTYCGSSTAVVAIKQSESTLWDQWVRLASSAHLSGKKLVIFSSNASGTCKGWSLYMKD
jgi:hypothetical protein